MPDETEEDLSIAEWENCDDKFALRVQGNSMIGDHIADGDFVVIDKTLPVVNGKIVALRDSCGGTKLRRYQKMRDGQLYLETSDGRPMSFANADDVEVLGVLVGVVRKC